MRSGWRSKARPVPYVLGAVCILAGTRGCELSLVSASPAAAVTEALLARGLVCLSSDVLWIDPPSGVRGAIAGRARALVRARTAADASDPSDLYLVEARLSPEGAVLRVGDSWNLTNTSGVDESRPSMHGSIAAYTTSADGLVNGIHVLDLAGPTHAAEAGFTRVQRAQAALTNLQQTGQMDGVAHTTFALDPVANDVAIAWRDDGALEARADEHRIVIDPSEARVLEGGDFVRVVSDERSRPGNVITWAVDRVRSLSWFGDDRMQWIKAVAFTALDKVRATFSRGTTAEDVRDEIGLPSGIDAPPVAFTDPEEGWPPAPLKPLVSNPLPGEGQWITLDKDPFITPTPSGSAPAFVTSFIRPDPHRADVRVYMTLWDPRQVGLHMEAGTVEPISATGEHGSGMIPRVPEVMDHVVAAFNGGFQAQHGEYGMQANGIEYLPPKPYGATVVELRDGSNGFGAWPDSAIVPDDVIGLRQNLTALVQDGKFNPWGRTWWGGAPPGWPDQIHTARSAICLTRDGFAGYFYSSSISAEDLAQGMLAARCSFGIHLDMNAGHAGFEFYDVVREGAMAPLARPLQGDWEAAGKVPDMGGYVFRARRMIRGMGHMLFPRYIQREARDFFYLTSRQILPGAPVRPVASEGGTAAPPSPDEGLWRTKGLPQHGFPYSLAITWVRAHLAHGMPSARAEEETPDLKIRIIRADPRTMRPAPVEPMISTGSPGSEPTGPATVLSLVAPVTSAGTARSPRTLWWQDGLFAIAGSPATKSAMALLGGCATTDACAAVAHAALGIEDETGMFAWVELPPEARADSSTAEAMDEVLGRLGCTARMAIPGRAEALLGGALDAAGDPVVAPDLATARLVRGTAPDAHPIFADTPIVSIQVWQPLQSKRVRYFYKPPPKAVP
jgi:hypothetical protein